MTFLKLPENIQIQKGDVFGPEITQFTQIRLPHQLRNANWYVVRDNGDHRLAAVTMRNLRGASPIIPVRIGDELGVNTVIPPIRVKGVETPRGPRWIRV